MESEAPILFQVHTEYDERTMRRLNEFHIKRRLRVYRLFRVLGIVILVCLVFMGVSALSRRERFWSGRMTSPAVLMLLAFFMPDIAVWSANRVSRRNKTPGLDAVTLSFYDEGMSASFAQGSAQVFYNQLCGMYETEAYFYLYITKYQCYPLDKTKFLAGTPQALAGFLEQKTGKRIRYMGKSRSRVHS